jgi:DNA-binding transcriptional LysR family regulator
MIITLHLLRSLVLVADAASYTRAAEALFLGQPTVYQHIRQLEGMYGTRLIEQSGKRACLTEHGRLVYNYACRILALADELTEVLHDDVTLRGGSLILAAGTTPGEFLLPEICVRFQALHPAIDLHLRIVNSPAGIDDGVQEHKVDLGFHSDPTPRPGVMKEAFISDTLILLVPRGHRLADRWSVRPQDLEGERLIRFEAYFGASLTERADAWVAKQGIKIPSTLTVNSLQAVKSAVRAGGGVAIASEHAVRLGDDSLAVITLEDGPMRHLFVVSRETGWKSHLLRAFHQFVLAGSWRVPILNSASRCADGSGGEG